MSHIAYVGVIDVCSVTLKDRVGILRGVMVVEAIFEEVLKVCSLKTKRVLMTILNFTSEILESVIQ